LQDNVDKIDSKNDDCSHYIIYPIFFILEQAGEADNQSDKISIKDESSQGSLPWLLNIADVAAHTYDLNMVDIAADLEAYLVIMIKQGDEGEQNEG